MDPNSQAPLDLNNLSTIIESYEASKTRNPCDKIRLNLALGCAVYYHDEMNNNEKAKEVAESALVDSLEAIDNVDEETFKIAKVFIETLKDKLTLWSKEE